jgi:hypothetical protein
VLSLRGAERRGNLVFQTITNDEIASLRSQRRLLEFFTNESILAEKITAQATSPALL